MSQRDSFGNPIKAGDVIAYPGRQSSRMWINAAVVTKVDDQGVSAVHVSEEGRSRGVRVNNPDRAVVVPLAQLKSDTPRNAFLRTLAREKLAEEAGSPATETDGGSNPATETSGGDSASVLPKDRLVAA